MERKAVYMGIDGFNRPVFKETCKKGVADNYYCSVDKLFSHYENFSLEKLGDNPVLYYKGHDFDGEPHYPVTGVIFLDNPKR